MGLIPSTKSYSRWIEFSEAGKDFSNIQYNRFYNSDIFKYYIEPGVTFRAGQETFAASISARISVIKFKNISTDYTQEEKESYRLDSLNRYSTVFFEPAVVNSFGFNKLPGLRIEYQLGVTFPIDLDKPILNYRPFNFSIGLVFDIGKLIKGAANKTED